MESFGHSLWARLGTRSRSWRWSNSRGYTRCWCYCRCPSRCRRRCCRWGACRASCGCRCRSWARSCAVSATGAGIAVGNSSPDDHFVSGPYCSVMIATVGRIDSARSQPGVCDRIVSTAGVEIIRACRIATPNDHFTSTPYCGLRHSAIWRVDSARCHPSIQLGIVPTAGVQVVGKPIEKIPSPNDHFTASPHCRVDRPATRRIGCARSGPAIHNRIVSTPRLIEKTVPNNHLATRPNCRMRISWARCTSSRGSGPTVCSGIVSPAGI